MGANQTELVRGTLDMLILKTLSLQPMHGLGISRRMEQITDGAFQVKPGSLFPAFHRLEHYLALALECADVVISSLHASPLKDHNGLVGEGLVTVNQGLF